MTKNYSIGNKTDGWLNSKEKWKNLVFGSKLRLSLFILILAMFLILIGYFLYLALDLLKVLIKEGFGVLQRYFGTPKTITLLSLFMTSIFISALVTLIVWLLFYGFNKKGNRWFWLNCWIMAMVIIFGFFAIANWIENPVLKLNLFDVNNVVSGTIECAGVTGTTLVNEEVYCKTDYNKEIMLREIFVSLTFKDRSPLTQRINNSFIALENVTYISFDVYDTYKNNLTRKLSVGYPFSFLSKDKFAENKEKFLKFLIALIAATFISVPIMTINLRNLWRNKKD